MPVRRALVTLAVLAALAGVPACGDADDGTDAGGVLADTGASITAQRQGTLSLRVAVFGNDPGSDSVHRVGFEIVSRFDLTTGARLPVADIAYLSLHGAEETEWSFGSSGEVAFVEQGGAAYAVPPAVEAQIAAMAAALHSLDGVAAWVRDPSVDDDVNAETVRGEIDPLPLLHDVLALGLAVEPSSALPDPGTVPDDALASSVRSGTFEMETLKADDSLGHLLAVVELDPAPYPEMHLLLGEASSLRLEVEVSAGPLDGPLTVATPAELQPWEALPPAAA